MKLVSIGDQVESGIYRFHSQFNRAVNFVHGKRLVSVVDEEVGEGPLNIVLRDLHAAAASHDVKPLEVRDSSVAFSDYEFPFSRSHRYHSTLPRARWQAMRFRRNLFLFGELLKTGSHPRSLAFLLDAGRTRNFPSDFDQTFTAHVKRSVKAIFRGDRLEGIRNLCGCGVGLTPSGDDFIAGYLIGLNVLQHLRGGKSCAIPGAVFRAAKSDNIFSNTFLDMARRGLLFGRMKTLVLALLNEGETAVRDAARGLFAIGSSSGADLGTGFFMTMRNEMGAP